MSAYAMFGNSPLPVLKSSCPKPSFSLSSTVDTIVTKTSVVTNAGIKELQRTPSKPESQKSSPIDHVFENEKKEQNNDLGIAVMSANIDCKRYIAATSGRRRYHIPSKHQTGIQHDSSDWEEAVEFMISITLNGRTYTRRRSFPRIVRLRNELVKEVRTRRRKHPGRFGVLRSFVFDATTSSSQQIHQQQPKQQHMEQDVLFDHENDDCATTNLCDVKGLSLTMMQSALNGRYCPAIETWLQSVSSELVDPHTSPTLADFLKEDNISEDATSISIKSKRQTRKRHQHSNQLWSILEDRPCIKKEETANAEHHLCEDIKDECSTTEILLDDLDEDNECDAYYNAI